MSRPILLLVLLGFGSCSCFEPLTKEPSSKSTGIVDRVHFNGFEQLNGTSNATTLTEIWKLPATLQLREQTTQKLAGTLAGLFHSRSGGTNSDCAQLLRPLLDDFWQREFYIEWTRQGNRGHDCTIAIQLSEERLRIWETSFSKLASGWKVATASGTHSLSHANAKSWFVITTAPGASARMENSSVFREIETKGRPIAAASDYLLKAEFDLMNLVNGLPLYSKTNSPRIEFTLSGKGSRIRSEARVSMASPISWRPERWRIPTNSIHDPKGSLMSFTALQGVSNWLSQQPFVKDLNLQNPPNQIFAWGDSHAPLQIFAAARIDNATNFLGRFAAQSMSKLNSNLRVQAVGELKFLTNSHQIQWIGLPPILRPFFRPAPEADGNYFMAGLCPMEDRMTNSPPTELLGQITSRTNLVYYDWEITQERLAQLRFAAQYLPMIFNVQSPGENSAALRWLDAIEAKLGNSVTEISVVSPRELKFVRNSQIGLNGLELLALAYWLQSANFPAVNYQISFQPPSRHVRIPATP